MTIQRLCRKVVLSETSHNALLQMLEVKHDKLSDEAENCVGDRLKRLEASLKLIDTIIDELEVYDLVW